MTTASMSILPIPWPRLRPLLPQQIPRWEILPESTVKKMGVDAEAKPRHLNHLIHHQHGEKIAFDVSENKGPYRLLVYVIDGQGKTATANVPFYVN